MIVNHLDMIELGSDDREHLAQQQPQRKSRDQRKHADDQRFHQQHQRNAVALYAHHEIQTKFFFSPTQ